MSKMTQKEAVYQAVINVVAEFEGTCLPSKEQRAQVNNILFQGFRSETIELDRTYTDSELRAYVSGLQSNWLRKDGRLNGGIKYVPKNPGSRAGSGDAMLKAMRGLLATVTDPSDKADIEAHIAKRIAEIKPAKSAAVVNVADLPVELQHLFKA